VTRANVQAWCDFAFFMGTAAENAAGIGRLKLSPECCGVKFFMGTSTGNSLIADNPTIKCVLRHGVRRPMRKTNTTCRIASISPKKPPTCAHTVSRDAESARLATERLLRIAKRTRRRVHVLHITTAGKVTFLATHKDVATVEYTPQHLILSSPDLYDRLRPFAQINSPLRDAHHRAKLWTGVQSGVLDVFGFGHAPHTREENPGTYPNTPSGMPSVQILVPVMLNHVHEGRLSLERFVDLTAHGPQRVYNIAGKGRLAVGYDADFTLIDLQGTRTITDDWIVRKCGWTPFIDMKTT